MCVVGRRSLLHVIFLEHGLLSAFLIAIINSELYPDGYHVITVAMYTRLMSPSIMW